MAKIPVEKESGGAAWWMWLLGLVALVLAVWTIWALVDDDEEQLALEDDVEVVEPDVQAPPMGADATAGGLITDVSTIFQATDREALVGREVRLTNMAVRAVPGDSVFYVAVDENVPVEPENRVIVASLDEVIPAQPEGVEGRYDVTEGQTVTIYGSVQAIQQQHPNDWGITQDEADDFLERDQIYVRAQRLEITDRPGSTAASSSRGESVEQPAASG